MNNGNQKFLFKQINKEYILTGLLAVLVFATVLFPIRDLDQITTLGNEIQYWGGAMSILGQNWASYMDGETFVSYGYSLILLPICMLIHNASFAYKAAIILNGFIWVLTYLCSVHVGKKILDSANSYTSTIGCFLIYLLPIYTGSRALIGPEALLILMFWFCTDLVLELSKHYSFSRFCILGILMVTMVWLDPSMIIIVATTIGYFCIISRKKGIEERVLLKWILFVVLGIVVGNIAEQYFLNYIFSGTSQSFNAGIQIFLEKCIENWSTGGAVGCLFSLIGKIFSCTVNTMGLFLAFLFVIKKAYRNNASLIDTYLAIAVIGTILSGAWYWWADEASQGEVFFYYGNFAIVAGPVLLLCIREILEFFTIAKKTIACFLSLFGLTSVIDYFFRAGGKIDIELNTGIISLIQSNIETVSGTIYFCVAIVTVIFLFVLFILNLNSRWKQVNATAKIIAFVFFSIGGIALNCFEVNEIIIQKQKECASFSEISEILNQISDDTKCYYFKLIDESDQNVPVLQMLSNKKNLICIADEDGDQELLIEKESKKEHIIVTPTPVSQWENKLKDYQVSYITEDYILWTNLDSVRKEIDGIVGVKEIKVKKTNGGKNSVYGKGIILAPGTYVAHCEFRIEEYRDEIGSLSIESDGEVIQTLDLSQIQLKKRKKETINLYFTSDKIMDDVIFKVTVGNNSQIIISKISYQKIDSNYTIGLTNKDQVNEIYELIQKIDKKVGKKGSVYFADNNYSNHSMTYINKLFDGYQLIKSGVSDVDIKKSDYLIFETQSREYYELMKKYSVLFMNETYTLLSKKGSVQCDRVKELQGFIYSDNYKIDIRAFLFHEEKEGDYNYLSPIKLQGGNYNYISELTLTENKKNKNILGDLLILNGSTELKRVQLTKDLFDEQGKYNSVIPLEFGKTMSRVNAKLELEEGVKIKIIPSYIELKQQKYMLGQEEKEIQQIANLINASEKNSRIVFLIRDEKEEDSHSFDYLQELMPGCSFENMLYKNINDEKGDLFVITYGYSKAYFEMAKKYTIVAVAGKYLLWTKSDGRYLMEALEHGGVAYSHGGKISSYCLTKIQGKKYDGTISILPSGTYRIYLDIQVTEPQKDDIIEVGLQRDKTEQEIEEETEELKKYGYTEEQIEKIIEKVSYTQTKKYSILELSDNNTMLTSFEMHFSDEIKNLQPVAYCWKQTKVKAKIIWIELIQ